MSTLLSLALLCVACESSHSGTPTENGVHPSIERLVAAYCERQLECPGGALSFLARETCRRAQALRFCAGPMRPRDVAECERALRTQDCASVTQGPLGAQGCEAVLQSYLDGLKPVEMRQGGPCLSAVHCPVGMRCERASPDCSGTCVPSLEEGEPCLQPDDCRMELFCSGDNLCERPRPAGSPCRTRLDCAQDCVGGVCVATLELLHGPCVKHSDCGATLRCRNGVCSQAGGAGAPCDAGRACYPGLFCASGRCVPLGACHAGELDDPCVISEECQNGLTCNSDERRCAEPPQRGEACWHHLLCASGNTCRFAAGAGEAPVRGVAARQGGR